MRRQTGQKRNRLSDRSVNLVKRFPGKKRILVLDDDDALRDVLEIIFTKAGYIVDLYYDARDILEKEFIIPDVFLIDKLLSGANGLDVCRQLKRRASTHGIPIIMISASPGIEDQAMEAEADDYIAKPFDKKDLLDVIERNIASRPAVPHDLH